MSLSRHRQGRDEGEDGPAGGEDPWESTPAKRPRRCSCSCSCGREREIKDFYEGQIEILKKEMECMSKGLTEERKALQREMQAFYRNSQLQFKEQMSERLGQLFREQFNAFISEISTSGDRAHKFSDFRTTSSYQRKIGTCKLKFENKCCNDKYSRHDIMADDGSPIKVAIYDHDNQIISNGSLSSIRVKIVVLNGEFNNENKEQWSSESFLRNIVRPRPGKPPLFASELYLRLEKGVANLYGAKFQDNSSFVPSKKFRLGVMAADDNISEKILEGISEPFAVKDGRGYMTKKDPCPSVSDPIYKLKKIAVNGDRRKLLENMHIYLVKDFLWFYNKDRETLRKACEKIPDHDWHIIVQHALRCKPGPECYSYRIPAMDATIFFNSLYNIVGAEFNGIYTSYDELNDTQRDLLKVSKMKAYDNLKVVQYEEKDPSHELEVKVGDQGGCYLRASCSTPPLPTLTAASHDDSSHHGEVLEGGRAQESSRPRPRPRQRWVKVVTMVTRNKKAELSAREMRPTPSTERPRQRWVKIVTMVTRNKKAELSAREMHPISSTETSLGRTDMRNNSWAEADNSWDWVNAVLDNGDWSSEFLDETSIGLWT